MDAYVIENNNIKEHVRDLLEPELQLFQKSGDKRQENIYKSLDIINDLKKRDMIQQDVYDTFLAAICTLLVRNFLNQTIAEHELDYGQDYGK
ncbi:MAG: hypothetical protein PHO94_12535 [Petrimonas sp.]|nr:hypothetical protein [Petrimonas sp.]